MAEQTKEKPGPGQLGFIAPFSIKNKAPYPAHAWSPRFDTNTNPDDRSGGLVIPGQTVAVPDVVHKLPFYDEEGKQTLRPVSLREEVMKDISPGGKLHDVFEISKEAPQTARQIAEAEKKKRQQGG